MRLRRKKNLDQLIEKTAPIMINCDKGDKNASTNQQRFLDVDALFGRSAPLWLDLGCGKGVFALAMARKHADVNIVAIDRISNVLVEGALGALEEGLANIRFFCIGAEYLPRFFPPQSVDKIFLYFSTPFPKAANENRRLTYKDFAEKYFSVLKADGVLELKTDDRDFFEYSMESLGSVGFVFSETDFDAQTDGLLSEHEKMFRDQGKTIFRLSAVKQVKK